ncbi:hypothetical protein CsSME_00023372 [Camellia sinensis var. sinensis]
MELLLNDITLIRILEIVLSFQKLTNIGYSATILNQSPTTAEAKQEHFKALVSQAATPFLIRRTDRFHLGWKVSGITIEDEEGEVSGNAPSVPYLFLFDEDSDGIE